MIHTSLRTTLAIAGTLLALAIAAPAEAARFTINIDDGGTCNGTWMTTGSAANPTIACVQGTSSPPPTAAPQCTPPPASQNVPAGATVTLALANCSPSTLTYLWTYLDGTPNGIPVSGGPNFVATLFTTATYNAKVTDTVSGQSATYSTTVIVGGSGTPSTPSPPSATGICSGYSVVDLGDISFNGARIATEGVSGSAVVVGRIVVPNPLPAGWAGKVATISAYEYYDPQYAKKMYVTPTYPCDFRNESSPYYGLGNSMSIQVSFENPMYNAVPMEAGDVWYLTIKNERLGGTPSCAAGRSCNFGITLSAPSSN